MVDAAELGGDGVDRLADDAEVVGVDEHLHALALHEAAQRAAHDVEHRLRTGLHGAGDDLARELERELDGAGLDAVGELGALGVQLFSNVNGAPLDDPRFDPILARMEALDRMIWLHPTRDAGRPDYATERESDFGIWWSLGWPYETAAALSRLVYSGQMDRHPRLRVIAHHGGGMVPHFSARLAMGPG